MNNFRLTCKSNQNLNFFSPQKSDSEDAFGENAIGGPDNEEEFEVPLPNCTQLDFYFEQAGIGVGREENYRIFLALKQLIFTHQLGMIRFWG